MKKNPFGFSFIFILGIVCTLSSCCTKKGCTATDGISVIRFENFGAEEVEHISVETFQKDSGFSNRTDSFFASAQKGYSDTAEFVLLLPKKLSLGNDYKITLLIPGREEAYFLNKFLINRRGCNNCFPYRPASDYVNDLVGYSLNGEPINGNEIIISK